MLELIKPGFFFDFMKVKWYALTFSIIISLIAITSIVISGFSYGIDFAGGTVVQVRFARSVKADEVRVALKSIGLANERIQSVGQPQDNEFLLRTAKSEDSMQGMSEKIKEALVKSFGLENVQIQRVEMVGGAVSQDIKNKGFLSLFYASLLILVYIWLRFDFKYSIGAIVATLHDVIVVLGVFSLLGKEMDLTVVASFLTLIGYSLNDTVVVFDRIRENVKKQTSSNFDMAYVMSSSISQTLSRTILTSLTVFIVALILFLFGGAVIHNFALVMLIGTIIGCYSSIFVASPIVLFFSKEKAKA
ncbi:MAG: protein translocase subunit SecF [Syntrophaceae bacterium]